MLTASLTVAKKFLVSSAAVTAVVAFGFGSVSSASALSAKTVKMTLPHSVAPAPVFQASGVCGPVGANNSTTCSAMVVKAIDAARKVEPINAIGSNFNLAAFNKLSFAEQLFAIADIERTARGLAPIEGLTTQLDTLASQGAAGQRDPAASLPLSLSGGGFATYYGSNWAEGTANALGADYYWMYDDGTNSPNVACRRAGEAGCWGHRENVLGNYTNTNYCPAGMAINTVMGTAEITSKVAVTPSIAEIFVNDCGKAPTMYFTWPDVQKLVFGR